MKKDIQLLKGGLFDKPFMQSRIKTHAMTFKEKLLGYFLGPAGMIVFYALMTNLRELYYTSVIPVDNLYGTGTYMTISILSSVVGVLAGVGFSWMLEHTNTRAGKIRPYLLIVSFIMLISGALQFFCPFAKGSAGMLAWLFVMNVIYAGIAVTCYSYRYQKIGLATRSQKDRSSVTTVYNAADSLISGVIVGLVVSSILYYSYLLPDTTGDHWRNVVLVTGLASVPLILLEYFYTRERVTEENEDTIKDKKGNLHSVPIKQQIKDLLTNKYYLLALAVLVVGRMSTYMLGSNVRTNYCQWVLGANAENNLQIIYQSLAMAPMGFGVLLIYPAVKKFGNRKVVMFGSLLCILGGVFCIMNPYSIPIAFVGSFILNFGTLCITYLQITFSQQANDIVEYEHGYRPEGSTVGSMILLLYPALLSPCQGLYETVLVSSGYDAYAPAQNHNTIMWIVLVWYGVVVIKGLVDFLCLTFFDAEKKYPNLTAILKERHKEAVLARGEEWIDEEERERREKQEAERLAEEGRIADLKEKCARKGLDFDTENQKYLARQQAKAARKAKKKAKSAN